MLGELLPISDSEVSHATLRRHALAVGALDQRVTEPDEYDWPESRRDPVPTCTRLIVAIDGTYVRANLGWLRGRCADLGAGQKCGIEQTRALRGAVCR